MIGRRRALGALLAAATATATATGCLLAGRAARAAGPPRPPRPILAPEGTQAGGLAGGTAPADIASKCSSCHSGGSDDDGKTFRPWSTWSGTMMANATRDPLFAAALALSEQDAPGSGAYCLRCHTPKGFVNGRATGTGAALDANDHQGVDCEACHRSIDGSVAQPAVDHQGAAIAALAAVDPQAPYIGNARLTWDSRDIRHGPRDDADSPAHAASKTTFTSSSEMCGQCHEVLSPLRNLLDAAGNDTGFPFPLDNTYTEWRYSDFARAGTAKSCIDCHMPAARGDALTVSSFSSSVPRANPRKHLFVGGNEWGLDAVKLAAPEIATERELAFDASKEAVRALLATAVKIDLQPGAARESATSFDVTVRVTNLSGHKFPTGYADGRRAFLQVELTDAQGRSLGLLGRYDDASARIDMATKLRVWESIQAEHASHKEWHIAKNDSIVEDTRIPPQGFRPEGAAAIAMTAPVGADYGPATGMRHYDEVPVRFTALAPLPAGSIRVTARVFYQSTMREFIEELARANTTDNRGTALMAVWEQTGRAAPRLIASESADVTVGAPTGAGGAPGGAGGGQGGGGGRGGGGGSSASAGCGCALADQPTGGTLLLMWLSVMMRWMYRPRHARTRTLTWAGLALGLGLLGVACGGGGKPSNTGSGGTGGALPCTPMAPLERRVWRLSAEQWGSAVKDLLGLAAAPVLSNRGGQAAYAFFADATLDVDENFQFALYQAAQGEVLPEIASRIAQLAPCSETSAAGQTACAQTFVEVFGKKAFRRPLTSDEVTALMEVYTEGAKQSYDTGISLVVQAAIISPSFVYRTELGPPTLTADANGKFPDTTLTPYEVASQLGFLFLGSLPDAELTAAADDGRLATADGIRAQIDRLLALPAVEQHLTDIVIDWFNVRQMFDKGKNTELFAALPAAERDQIGMAADLHTSARRLVTDLLWTNPGNIDDLFTSQNMFVNRRMTVLYPNLGYPEGLPASQTTFVKATWAGAEARAGMLTHPAVLWAASDPDLTSIVKRGKFLHDDVMCQDALPPPIDLTSPMALNVIACKSPDGATTLSPCDSEILQSDARMMYQPCKACHAQIDPYARAIQSFGPIGNYRTVDEAGRAVVPTVTFPAGTPLGSKTVSGSAAFGQALVDAGIARGCAVQKMASYTVGTMIRTYNTCELKDVRAEVQTDGTVKSLFRNVALANFVRARTGGSQ